jgi:hypothetical protein
VIAKREVEWVLEFVSKPTKDGKRPAVFSEPMKFQSRSSREKGNPVCTSRMGIKSNLCGNPITFQNRPRFGALDSSRPYWLRRMSG